MYTDKISNKIVIFLLPYLLSLSLTAQVISYNQEFQVNSNTSGGFYPSIGNLSDGGFVVCWVSGNVVGGHGFAQLYGNNGDKIGEEIDIISNSPRNVSVSGTLNNKFIVCWDNYSKDGILAQLFDSKSGNVGPEFLVSPSDRGDQENPSVCVLNISGFIICYESYFQEVIGKEWAGYGIFAQRFDNNGIKLGIEFHVNTHKAGDQINPRVSGFIDDKFIICWESYGQDGSLSGIFAQLFDNYGNKIGAEFQVNSYIKGDQINPAVSGLTDGNFIVCWQSFGQDGSYDGIFAQLFDNNGAKIGIEFQVNSYTLGDQYYPFVCSLSNVGFIVCWMSSLVSGQCGVYAQIFDNNGEKIGTEFRVSPLIYHQYSYSLSRLSKGGFAICWDRYLDGIYGKYYINPINHQLSSFSLLEPVYDSTIETTSITFKWSTTSKIRINLPYELEYRLYIDETEDFSNPQVIPAIYDTTCVVDSLLPSQTYFWKVQVFNIGGDSLGSTETFGFFVSPAAQMDVDQNNSPSAFELFQNYPNPFNPQTTIRYSLPDNQSVFPVVVQIYDILGQLVITLKNERQHPGMYNLTWDGRDVSGQLLPSGIYFCQLSAGRYNATQKMLLVR